MENKILGKFLSKKALLLCGILSSVLYIGTDILANTQWESYSFKSQTISELIAINAPTRTLVVLLFIIYGLLIFAFGIGVWQSGSQKRALRISGILIIGKEVLGIIVTLFFPIHLRGVESNYSDIMHGILTTVGVFLFMFPAMGFGATAFGKKFRLYSIMTMIVFILFGILSGLSVQQYDANLPTPWLGIWERINIYGYMIWIIVLALILLKNEKIKGQSILLNNKIN